MNDQRVDLAVMFTDIHGFSAMMSADEVTTVRVVREHRAIVRQALANHGGREQRTIGDAFLVVFDTARSATRCAKDILWGLGERNAQVGPSEQVWVRVGLHWGPVLVGGEGELYGETVNIAARVEPHAAPGGICATRALHEAVGEDGDVRWESVGTVPLKNIRDPIALFKTVVAGPGPGASTTADPTFSGNVPRALTQLVGREPELESLRHLLLSGERLITLVGPGGVGKTTLLGEVGRTVGPGWSGGVWFAELAAATDLVGVGGGVAAALGVAAGDDPVGAVAGALRARQRTLLLLDNAEQAVDAVARAVATWLERAPGVTCVVTSRERLALAAERMVPIGGLPLEHAVELFCERARAVRPDFAIEDARRAEVEALLERLDRMPLAIELFAARLRLEPLDRLRKHLDAHLDVKAARRDGPARQATLRSTIAWSWALLLPEEQEALARLTVFRGAAPIDGVEAVLGDDGLAFAASLVDKSLLRAIDAGLTFYESIRAFAAAHLAPDDRARLRHAEYFVERTRSARPGELKSHRDDLPAAFETCLAVERRDDAARLWIAWQENGQATTPLSRLVAESARVPPVVDDAVAFEFDRRRANALVFGGDVATAETVALAAVERARKTTTTTDALAHALRTYASVLAFSGRDAQAIPLAEEAFTLASTPRLRSACLQTLALAHARTSTTRSDEYNRASLALAEEVGDPLLCIVARHNRALGLMADPDLGEAEALYAANLEAARALDDPSHIAPALSGLANIWNLRGDFERARTYAAEGTALSRTFGLTRWVGGNLVPLAVSRAGLGDPAALALADEAVTVTIAGGDPRQVHIARACRAWALALVGRKPEARDACAEVRHAIEAERTDLRSMVGAVLRAAEQAGAG